MLEINSVIILTHIREGEVLLPHYDHLVKSNPDVGIYVVVGEDSEYGKKYNWKNGDMPLRKWWKNNSNNVNGDGIAVIEWDTLVNTDLPSVPMCYDLVGKKMIREDLGMRGTWKPMRMHNPKWHDRNWMWWKEVMLFDPVPKSPCIGLISLGAFFMHRKVLDAVCEPQWDYVYSKSMISELRFPTVAHLSGARVGEIDLPNVDFRQVKPGDGGIYHSVKEPYVV